MQIWKQFSNDSLGPKTREIASQERERLFFLMHQMLKCGQPAESSLRAVSRSFRDESKEEISLGLNAIAQKVAQGKSLSKSMESEYIMFSDIHRAAIMAGEAANNMTEAFHILQVLEQKKIDASRTGLTEILTPGVLFILSSVSLFNTGINTLPVMAQMKKAQGKPLSPAPQAVMEFTSWCADYWYYIMAIFILIFITGYSVIKSSQGRFWLDVYILKIPGYGKYIAYKTYASMLLYFPHLIASGVKPKQMIPIMEALASNIILKRKIDSFNRVITTGGQMSEAMEKAGFPPIAVTPVRVSENYAGGDDGVNNIMIEGMNHSYSILERDLADTHNQFITVTSTLVWIMGGMVMMLEMLSIILSQN